MHPLGSMRRSVLAIGLGLVAVRALAQQPSPALRQADVAYRAGQAALARKDLAAAQGDFEQVVRLAPTVEQGHSALGSVLLRRGRLKEAIRELEAALAIDKTDAVAQMNLAMACEQAGLPAKAVPLFHALEAGAGQPPLSAAVLAAYARALTATGQLRQATAKLAAAVQADPRNAELHDGLGSLFAQQREWSQAQPEFAAALQLNPGLALAHLHLGLTLQALGQDGTSQLAEASRLAPGDPRIAIMAGKGFAAAGKDDRAAQQFRQALDHDPASIPAMYQLALALQRLNRVPEAVALLRKVVAAQPDNAPALTNLGMALTQAQQAREAVPILQHAVKVDPAATIAHEDLAAAYVQLNQLDDAIAQLQTALKASDSPQLHYDLGLAFKMQDHPEAAIPQFEAAERLDPASPEAPYALGLLYLQAARYPDAAREIKKSLELHPENGDGWATLGSVYNKLDQLPEATAALREATRQLPEQPDPHLTLAAVLVKQNQQAEAVAERRKAADLMRGNMNRQRAEVATNAGNGLLKSGDLAGAAERFRDALTYDSGYREAHLGLASALDAQGRTVEAAAERKLAGALPK